MSSVKLNEMIIRIYKRKKNYLIATSDGRDYRKIFPTVKFIL